MDVENMKFNSYFIHGLIVLSQMSFPELVSIENTDNFDVIIDYDDFIPQIIGVREVDLSDFTKIFISPDGIDLLWNNIPLLRVLDGCKININPNTGLEENFLRLFILGYGFAILLYQRGNLILHANAIDMGDGALVLLGSRGSGKSTTSLALSRGGYGLVADDILHIKFDSNYPTVFSGFPRIKLWPDIIKGINEDLESIPRIHSKAEKRSYPLVHNFLTKSQRIKSFYFIEKGNQTEIEEMSSFDTLNELLKSSYCFKLFDENDLANNLKQCGELIKKVPVKKLRVKHSLKDFPQLVKIIEEDFF